PQLLLRMVDRAGNVTEQSLPELYVDTRPLVVDAAGVPDAATVRVSPATPILTFNEPPDLNSFDAGDLRLLRDGVEVSIVGAVSLAPIEGMQNQYHLFGLEDDLA